MLTWGLQWQLRQLDNAKFWHEAVPKQGGRQGSWEQSKQLTGMQRGVGQLPCHFA